MAFLMPAAAVSFFMVMVAVGPCGNQLSLQVIVHHLICIALSAGTYLNAGFGQRGLCSAAEAAADQHVDTLPGQKARQRAVSGPVGTDHLAGNHLAVFYFSISEKQNFSRYMK